MGTNVITIDIDQLPRELQRGEERFAKALRRGLRMGAERGRGIIVRRTPMDLGQLRGSWKVKAQEWTAELLNDAPHAGIVELGARPHKVSAEGWQAIYEWVRRHPELYGRKKPKTKVSATTEQQKALGPFRGLDPEITGITWAIVKKINKYGQKPTFFVMQSLDVLRQALVKEVERQLARATSKGGR
jgi:bacteriophage HK97-gp10 putative tail-component